MQIVFGRGRERSVAGIRQPDAAWNIEPWFLAPDGAGGKIRRLRGMRQHVDEDPRSRAPDRFGFRGRKNLCTGECRRNRRTIIFGPVGVGLRRIELRMRRSRQRDGGEDQARKHPPHGDFVVSARIGLSLSSSKGTPKSSRILLIACWFSWIRRLSCRFQFWSAGLTPMPIR